MEDLWKWIAGIVGTAVIGGGIAWMRSIHQDVRDVKMQHTGYDARLNTHAERITRNETRYSGIEGWMHRLDERLERIEDRLNSIARHE